MSSRKQHTKGPWLVSDSLIMSAQSRPYICEMNSPDYMPVDEIEANQRLITQAPELLKIAQRVLAMIDWDKAGADVQKLHSDLQRVIDLAIGKS